MLRLTYLEVTQVLTQAVEVAVAHTIIPTTEVVTVVPV